MHSTTTFKHHTIADVFPYIAQVLSAASISSINAPLRLGVDFTVASMKTKFLIQIFFAISSFLCSCRACFRVSLSVSQFSSAGTATSLAWTGSFPSAPVSPDVYESLSLMITITTSSRAHSATCHMDSISVSKSLPTT